MYKLQIPRRRAICIYLAAKVSSWFEQRRAYTYLIDPFWIFGISALESEFVYSTTNRLISFAPGPVSCI